MRNIVLFLILSTIIAIPSALKAQYGIPNGSFETWTGVNQPAKWTVLKGKPIQGQVFNYSEIDSVGDTLRFKRYAYNGQSFIDMPMQDTSIPCIISQKFPMTGMPKYFSMNYGYFPETRANQFQVSFFFTKWNKTTASEDTVLGGDYNSKPGSLNPQAPWTTLLNADLSSLYSPSLSLTPDTALVIITSSLQTSPNAKTLLVIDRIYFKDTIVSAGVKLPENEMISSKMSSAFPNPFSSKTTIKYNLTHEGQVIVNVYDENGRIVSALFNGNQVAGNHEAVFDGSGLHEGIYFYRLQSDNDIQTGKLILAR